MIDHGQKVERLRQYRGAVGELRASLEKKRAALESERDEIDARLEENEREIIARIRRLSGDQTSTDDQIRAHVRRHDTSAPSESTLSDLQPDEAQRLKDALNEEKSSLALLQEWVLGLRQDLRRGDEAAIEAKLHARETDICARYSVGATRMHLLDVVSTARFETIYKHALNTWPERKKVIAEVRRLLNDDEHEKAAEHWIRTNVFPPPPHVIDDRFVEFLVYAAQQEEMRDLPVEARAIAARLARLRRVKKRLHAARHLQGADTRAIDEDIATVSFNATDCLMGLYSVRRRQVMPLSSGEDEIALLEDNHASMTVDATDLAEEATRLAVAADRWMDQNFEDEDETDPERLLVREGAREQFAKLFIEAGFTSVEHLDDHMTGADIARIRARISGTTALTQKLGAATFNRLVAAGYTLAQGVVAMGQLSNKAQRYATLAFYDRYRGRPLPLPRKFLQDFRKDVFTGDIEGGSGTFSPAVAIYLVRALTVEKSREQLRSLIAGPIGFDKEERTVFAGSLTEAQREALRDRIAQYEREGRSFDDDEIAKLFSVVEQAQISLDGAAAKQFNQRKPYELTLRIYLELIENTSKTSSGQDADEKRRRQLTWALLRRARIFDIPYEASLALGTAAQAYAWKIVGLKPGDTIDEERGQRLTEVVQGMTISGQLPFDVTYFGLGRGITFGPNGRSTILSILITSDGHCIIFAGNPIFSDADRIAYFIGGPEAGGTRALPPEMLAAPWFVASLTTLVAEQQTFSVKADRSKWFNQEYRATGQKEKRDRNKLPEDYYLVTLKREISVSVAHDEIARVPHPRAPLSYRFDVRGTKRLLVRRGAGAVDEKVARILDRRGYKIFAAGAPIPADVIAGMIDRDLAPRAEGEWLAAKWVPVVGHIRGPKDKPYVPSVRRLAAPPVGVEDDDQ